MKKHVYQIAAGFITLLLLYGCILSQSPGSGSVSLEAGDELNFSIQVFPTSAAITWYFDDDEVAANEGMKVYNYAPDDSDIGDHTLRVVESSMFGTYSHTWNIEVVASTKVEISTPAIAEDILYAAYAGIGYMNSDSSGDDENIYRIMMADPIAVAGELIMDTLFTDPDTLEKLAQLILGISTSFTVIDTDGNLSALYINPGIQNIITGRRPFSGSFSVNFSEPGYAFGDCTYTSEADVNDLTGTFNGYFKASLSGLEEFFVKAVNLQIADTLTAQYSFGTVDYGQWSVSYTIYYGTDDPTYSSGDPLYPINVALIPLDIVGMDYESEFRDYTLGGSFAVDGQEYLFNPGFRYQQQELVVEDVTYVVLLINGEIQVPGIDGFVLIETPQDLITPLDGKTIVRDSSGILTSGSMTLSAGNTIEIEFDSGRADFSGDMGSWSVDNWQDTLEPF